MSQEGAGQPAQTQPPKERFKVWDGLNLVAHITGLVLGPLLLFGGIGLWLAKALGGNKIIFIVSVLFAFVVSNVLVFRKAADITKRYR